MAPIFPLTYSHTRCWRGLPRAGARPSQTHSLPLQDEESRVPQHAARGWCQGYWGPGEGRQGHLVKDGMGGHADRQGEGGDRLALGARGGRWEWTTGQSGWMGFTWGSVGVDMRYRRRSSTAAAVARPAGRVG